MLSLCALFFPALALPCLLGWLGQRQPNDWMLAPLYWPLELWIIASAGLVATCAGWLDHRFHSCGGRSISKRERVCERWALANGGVVFVLLCGASAAEEKGPWLLPVLVATISTVVLISYDEFLFHRRVGRYEARLHRCLTLGNGIAFLAWCHWCFVRGGTIA